MSATLAYALVAVGSGLALLNARTVFRTAVNTRVYLSAVRKWAEAGDHERIRRVVRKELQPELLDLTRRWLELELPPVVHEPGPRGYREPVPVVSLEERTREALAPHVEARRAWLKGQLPLSFLSAGLLLVAVVLGVEREGVPTLSAIGMLLAIYGGYGVHRLRRDLLEALEVVVTLPRPAELEAQGDREDVNLEPNAVDPTTGSPTRLALRSPGAPLRRIPLQLGVMKLGKLPSAHVKLDGERVSRIHAVLEVNPDEVVLIDLGSADGTRVNGEPIDRHVLQRHDRVAIGDHELIAG